MLDRIIGVFKLDVNTFEEIEADSSATGQAALVVLVAALLSGVGGGILASLGEGSGFVSGLIGSFISTLVGWVIWSAVTYFVGTTFFGGKSDLGQMLRVIGFAYAPQVLGIIPCIGAVIGFIWTFAAGFVAIRQGLDLDNSRACFTIAVGFIAYVILSLVLATVIGGASALAGGLGV